MSSVWSRLVGTAALCCCTLAVLAQNATITPKINSPYSRFGLGDFASQYYAGPGGMGGLSAAFHDPYHLNTLNPASLASLQATAFEVGLNAKYSALQGQDDSEGIWSGNLTYLALGFPLINPINEVLDRKRSEFGLGMAFALQPYTLVGYNIESTSIQDELGPATNLLKGTGGTNRLLWSSAARYKGFSGGFTFGYLFGQLTNSRRVELDSVELAYVTEFLDEVSINGFFWEAGLQYTHTFKKPNANGEMMPTGKRLILGAYGSSGSDFNTNTSRFAERRSEDLINQDTILNLSDVEQNGTLPSAMAFGLMFEDINDFRVGLEYGMENWSGYSNEAKPDTTLADTWSIRAGVEWIPDVQSYNNYFERMRYRFGFFYGLDPRTFEGEQLKEYGVSVGFGFPIIMSRQRISFINLALEAGQFGLADTLRETFVKMTLGFTLNDNTWFFKRKFN